MDILIGILVTLVVAALTPWFSSLLSNRIAQGANAARKQRALDSISQHPRARVGAGVDSLWCKTGAGLQQMPIGSCRITAIDLGFVEVTNPRGQTQNFTVEQWMGMDPLYAEEDKP